MINPYRKSILCLSVVSAMLLGCNAESPRKVGRPSEPERPVQKIINKEIQEWGKIQEPPPPPEKKPLVVSESFGNLKVDFNPKVDILFVVDNSTSMRDDQETLRKNIDKFVAAISANRMIDYHIGVVSVWDSKTFERTDIQVVKDFAAGQLRPLADGSAVYATRDTSSRDIGQMLKIGVEEWEKDSTTTGPEFEESFSPIWKALSTEMIESKNVGFYRPDAHLAVILLTDADDSTPNLSAEKLARELWALKAGKREMVSAYGVLSLKNDSCKKDPGLLISQKDAKEKEYRDPDKILEFLKILKTEEREENVFSLCDPSYGQNLARMGESIRRKTLRKEILLDGVRPNLNAAEPIKVFYGEQALPPYGAQSSQDQTWWAYDDAQNIIVINGGEIEPVEGAEIRVEIVAEELGG